MYIDAGVHIHTHTHVHTQTENKCPQSYVAAVEIIRCFPAALDSQCVKTDRSNFQEMLHLVSSQSSKNNNKKRDFHIIHFIKMSAWTLDLSSSVYLQMSGMP